MLPGAQFDPDDPHTPLRADAPADLPGTRLILDTTTTHYARPNGENYLVRDFGGLPDVLVMRALADAGVFVLLHGQPGSGKTALIEAAFPDLVTVQCSGDMTVAHLVGSHLPTPEGGWRWHDGPLTIALRTGKVLYLDELDLMPSEVSSILHGVMDGRGRLSIDDLPGSPPVIAAPGFHVVAAHNPDRRRRISDALLSRFTVQLEVASDYDTARALGVIEPFVAVAENLQLRNRSDRASGGRGLWTPQIRELLAAQRLMDLGLSAQLAASAMVGQCPVPEDVPEILDVCEHVLGFDIDLPRLGGQL